MTGWPDLWEERRHVEHIISTTLKRLKFTKKRNLCIRTAALNTNDSQCFHILEIIVRQLTCSYTDSPEIQIVNIIEHSSHDDLSFVWSYVHAICFGLKSQNTPYLYKNSFKPVLAVFSLMLLNDISQHQWMKIFWWSEALSVRFFEPVEALKPVGRVASSKLKLYNSINGKQLKV